ECRGAALVAAGDDDHRLRMVGVVARLDAIGHQLAGGEAVAGMSGTLRQGVRYRRCPDQETLAATRAERLDDELRSALHAVNAAMCIGVGSRDGDHSVAPCRSCRVEAGRTQLDGAQTLAGVVPVAGVRFAHGRSVLSQAGPATVNPSPDTYRPTQADPSRC